MPKQIIQDTTLGTASTRVAQTTNSGSIDLDNSTGYSVVAEITVTTPAAKGFVDADVTVGTDTIAEPTHGYVTGTKGQLTTTGVLPAGLALATDYFIIATDANSYKLANSLVNANANTAVDITAAAGGGTHTFTPSALAGASVKLQASNDDAAWVDIASTSNNITVAANFLWNVDAPYYGKVRMVFTLTGGEVTYTSKFRVVG